MAPFKTPPPITPKMGGARAIVAPLTALVHISVLFNIVYLMVFLLF